MNAKSAPPPAPEDLATKKLLDAVDSAIDGLQERLANLTDTAPDAKWSISDLVKLPQLRDQLHETQPSTITVRWVHDPRDPRDPANHIN